MVWTTVGSGYLGWLGSCDLVDLDVSGVCLMYSLIVKFLDKKTDA